MSRGRTRALWGLGLLLGGLVLVLFRPAGADGPDEASSWLQFRGPGRAGVSLQPGLRRSWPAAGPTVLWRRPLGEGFSSIAVAGDSLYTLFAVGKDEFAGSFQVSDGSEIWRVRIGDKYVEEFGNGPRATPTIDGDRVYALASLGNLFALDRRSGEILWQLNLAERFGRTAPPMSMAEHVPPQEGTSPDAGHASSPLVAGDLLIVYTGADKGKSVVALDKATGETRWTALDGGWGPASPVLVTIHGQPQILLMLPEGIVSLSTSGEVLWKHPLGIANFAQPIFIPPNQVFVSAAFDFGARLLAVERTPGGSLAAKPRWQYRLMRNYWVSSVFYRGHLFGFDHATLKCLDAASGEPRWAHRGLGTGSLVIADGLLLVLGHQGTLTLAEASPEGFKETGRAQVLSGRSLTPPTPAGGRLFLRNQEEMVSLDLAH